MNLFEKDCPSRCNGITVVDGTAAKEFYLPCLVDGCRNGKVPTWLGRQLLTFLDRHRPKLIDKEVAQALFRYAKEHGARGRTA